MKESVIVFYANCESSKKLGDFTACGSAAYCVGKKTDLPIILLSGDDGVERFDLLYRTSSGHHIYDMPVRIYSTSSFPSDNFIIAAHIAIGCKHNEEEYVKRVLLKDGGKAAYIATMGQRPKNYLKWLPHQYPDLTLNGQVCGFAFGFSESDQRIGIPFITYAGFAPTQTTKTTLKQKLPEKLIEENPGYGLINIPQFHPEKDIAYIATYLTLAQKRIVIALGDSNLILYGVEKFFETQNEKIVFINYDDNEMLIFSHDKEAIETAEIRDINMNSEKNTTFILNTKSVSNFQLHNLMINAGKLIGFSGASSAIEAIVEGKLIYYQCLREPKESFLASYLSSIEKCAKGNDELISFAKLLVNENGLSDTDKFQLALYLENTALCDELSQQHQSMIVGESDRMTDNLMRYLSLPVSIAKSSASLFGSSQSSPTGASNDSLTMVTSMLTQANNQ